ncbi:CD209 [Branchiostoma lanceolatum]|uniref:CD209 protein n=1 Tax=Branchiostoma lanceolatum TaxID=7740 RepID=A0A8J9Z828_BRALA|nr:CD209 [Branchiostoma lanceolatum]
MDVSDGGTDTTDGGTDASDRGTDATDGGMDAIGGIEDIRGLASTDKTNDVPNGHANHRSRKGGTNTVRQIDTPMKDGGHETDREARSTFPLFVTDQGTSRKAPMPLGRRSRRALTATERRESGESAKRAITSEMVLNMFKTVAVRAPKDCNKKNGRRESVKRARSERESIELPTIPTKEGETGAETVTAEDCNDGRIAEAHEYNYIDRDDVNNLQQSGEDNGHGEQPSNKDEDTSLPNNAQRDAFDLLNNPTYPLHSKNSTTDSPVRTNGLNLTTAAILTSMTTKLSEVTTIQPIVTGTLPVATITQPIVPATMPEVTTTQPKLTNMLPNVATALPKVTSILPVVTSTESGLLVSASNFMQQRKSLDTAKTEKTTKKGCHSGYLMHNNICFKAFNTPMNFPDASWTCRTEGGTLAMPTNASTNEFLISLKNGVDKQGCFWFGLVDQREEGVWEWIDGTPLGSYSAWGPGEPNNINDEDCALYDGTTWNDERCSRVNRKFICQVKPQALKSDGCPVGYKLVVRTCFQLNFRKMSYGDASKACKTEGAMLAMPKTEELDVALRNLVRTEGHNLQYWIGMWDTERLLLHKRQWFWEDGSKLGEYKQNH